MNNSDYSRLFAKLHRLLRPLPSYRILIAGGFAAEPKLAGDIDVWILGGQDANNKPNVQHYLPETWPNWPMNIKSQWDPAAIREYMDRGVFDKTLVRCFRGAWYGRDIQILTTSHRSAEDLLDSFDITTHMVAREWIPGSLFTRGRLVTYYGHEFFGVRCPGRVVRFENPRKSLERLEKLSKRYGWAIDADNLEELQARIAATEVMSGLSGETDPFFEAA